MGDSYIKLLRKLLKWEWFNDSKMVHVFIYFLLSANHTSAKWRGVSVDRGQLITGLNSIMKSTGLSVRSIRTCIERLKSTNEITIQSTNKFSIITIVKYDDYQNFDKKTTNRTTSKKTNERQSNDNQTTTNNNDNKEKEFIGCFDEKRVHPLQTYIASLKNVSGLEQQITFDNAEHLISKYDKALIMKKLLAMENNRDLQKKYKNVNLTLINWIESELDRKQPAIQSNGLQGTI